MSKSTDKANREKLLSALEASDNPKMRALAPRLRNVKSWTVEDLRDVLVETLADIHQAGKK